MIIQKLKPKTFEIATRVDFPPIHQNPKLLVPVMNQHLNCLLVLAGKTSPH